MTQGRKKIPSKIIEIKGGSSYTHRAMPTDEPNPRAGIPPCPKHLGADARKEWRKAAKILDSIGLLTELDKAVLAGYCESYAQWAEATRKIESMGMVYKKSDGTPALNPYLKVSHEAFDRMMKNAVLLGMSPSSRAGLKVDPKNKKKSVEEEKKGRFFKTA